LRSLPSALPICSFVVAEPGCEVTYERARIAPSRILLQLRQCKIHRLSISSLCLVQSAKPPVRISQIQKIDVHARIQLYGTRVETNCLGISFLKCPHST